MSSQLEKITKNKRQDSDETHRYSYASTFREESDIWINPILPKPINIKIDSELYGRILFRESLVISTTKEKLPVGGICLDIQNLQKDKFLLHLSSQIDVEGKNGGSRITAVVDKRCETLEERRYEFLEDDEKVLYANQNQTYYTVHEPSGLIKLYNKSMPLILEGANFILMRLMAISKFIGKFEYCTLNINGAVCRNIYHCDGFFSDYVNDSKLDLCKIYRQIIEKNGKELNSSTILTLEGQIVEHKWEDCDYYFHVNPFAILDNSKPTGNVWIPLKTTWENDMEMFSMYLDYKAESELTMKTYMQDHPEIKDLIGDFLKILVQQQPDNILDFTVEYFTNCY